MVKTESIKLILFFPKVSTNCFFHRTGMLLARDDKTSLRFYSMSAQIQVQRKYYYEILEQT